MGGEHVKTCGTYHTQLSECHLSIGKVTPFVGMWVEDVA